MAIHSVRLSVRPVFADTDAMGVIWHGNYYRYFEEARGLLLRSLGVDMDQVVAMGYHFPVIQSECRYIRPLRYGMVVDVEADLLEVEYKIVIAYAIRHEGVKMATGRTEHAVIDAETFQMHFEVPADVANLLKGKLQ